MEKYNKFMLDLPVELIPETSETGAEFKLSITDGMKYIFSLKTHTAKCIPINN